jgi:hypothetical protein
VLGDVSLDRMPAVLRSPLCALAPLRPRCRSFLLRSAKALLRLASRLGADLLAGGAAFQLGECFPSVSKLCARGASCAADFVNVGARSSCSRSARRTSSVVAAPRGSNVCSSMLEVCSAVEPVELRETQSSSDDAGTSG